MKTRTALTIAAIASTSACAGSDDSPAAANLAYTIPEPPSVVYDVSDSLSIVVDAMTGAVAMDGEASGTIGLAFGDDPDGLRVVGTVEAFAASVSSPLTGDVTADIDDVSGDLQVVLDVSGVKDLEAFPQLSGAVAQMSSFPALPYLLFPRLPGGEAHPGATWADTVTTTAETAELLSTINSLITYTLLGDTVVDGRRLLHISVANELSMENELTQGLTSLTQNLEGSADGFVLWDPERGLVAHAEYLRDLEGSTSTGIFGDMHTEFTGSTRLRIAPTGQGEQE